MTLRPPIAGADRWLPVMERARYRCECAGSCGRKHTGGRCPNGDKAKDRLMAVSETDEWRALADALVAKCPSCWRNWRRLADAESQPPEPEGLF